MKTMNAFSIAFLSMAALALASCDHDPHGGPSSGAPGTLAEVARIFSELPMEQEHLMEVFDAVGSSSGNGYDEEYMLSDLFSNPGAGVGDGLSGMRGHSGGPAGAGPSSYARPLKDLFTEHLARKYSTRGGERPR